MAKPWTSWFDPATLTRSLSYADGAVRGLRSSTQALTAEVDGSETYYVTLALDEPQVRGGCLHLSDLEGGCTCPVMIACKHAAAVLRLHEAKLLAASGNASAGGTDRPAKKSAKAVRPVEELPPAETYERVDLTAADQAVLRVLTGSGPSTVPVRAGKPLKQQLLYVLDRTDLRRLSVRLATARRLKSGAWGEAWEKGDPFTLFTRPPAFLTAEDRQLLGLLLGSSQHAAYSHEPLTLAGAPGTGDLLQRLLATGRLVACDERPAFHGFPVTQLRSGPPARVKPTWVAVDDGRWRLRLGGGEVLMILPCSPPLGLLGDTLVPLEATGEVQHLAGIGDLPSLDGPTALAVARALRVEPPPVVDAAPVHCQPVARLWRTAVSWAYVRDGGRRYTIEVATLSFRYGERVVRACDTGVRVGPDGPLRNLTAEAQALRALTGNGLVRLELWNAYPWQLSDRAAVQRIHHSLAPRLPGSGSVPAETHTPLPQGALLALVQAGWRIERPDGTTMERAVIDGDALVAEVGDGDDGDWFQLHLGIEVDGQRVDLAPALAPLVAGGDAAFAQLERDAVDGARVLLPLNDGRLVRLPGERLRRLVQFIGSLFAGGPGGLGITPEALLAADDLADVLPRWLGADRLCALAERLRPLLKPGEVDPPPGFTGTLRPYQRQGLAWLQRLREARAGGVLADDMGLGKTVQVLAHLALEHAAGRLDRPVLVVAPASVAPNWVREARRFAPMLRAVLHHGQERHDLDPTAHDLVVTTYGTLLRDEERLAKQEWSTLICDEAQFLKNANAKAAQAVRALKAASRLSLTGTPVENHLGELWAQLHWLNPGLLGSRKAFDQAFRTPIEKNGDQARLTLLQRRIAPFLLRRTKNLVATDLPAKTSSVLSVRLEGAQRDLYEAVRTAMDSRLADALKAKGLNRSRIEVLDALLKLRQCCCDPRLVKTKGMRAVKDSAKLDALADLLPTLIADGRRILLFSQFTSMLDLIDERLEKLGIARVMLTGDTPVPARQALVDRFQRGEVPVFLISLKAGGTGLNLTTADTVVLYDPWWNPAAEDQAIDRAHRIGQDKPVFVYRLVAQGTVEERMLDLQARKRALADALYGDEERVAGDLTEADLAALLAPITG